MEVGLKSLEEEFRKVRIRQRNSPLPSRTPVISITPARIIELNEVSGSVETKFVDEAGSRGAFARSSASTPDGSCDDDPNPIFQSESITG